MRVLIRVLGLSLALAGALGGKAALAADKLVVGLPGGTLGATVPIYLAAGKGYFTQAGVDVKITTMENPSLINASLLSGDVDLSGEALLASFFNVAGNGDLRIIAGDNAEAPGFRGQVVVVSTRAYDAGVKSVNDLTGKKIAVGTLASAHEYDLYLLTKKFPGYKLDIKNLVPLSGYPNSAAAMIAGSVDAGVLNPPVTAQMVKDGTGKVLSWIGDDAPYEQGSVITNRKAFETKREALKSFLRAYLKACADYAAAFEQKDSEGKLIRGPGADEIIQILAKAIDQPIPVVANSLPYIQPKAAVNRPNILEQLQYWQGRDVVPKTVDGPKLVDTSLLEEVVAGK